MSKRGENIFKRKDGRWEARYVKSREVSGKIRFGYCYGRTYREAREKAARCKAALVSGVTQPACGQRRFSFFCEEWLRDQRQRVKESSYAKYSSILALHILPKLGACPPLRFSTGLVDGFRQELLDEGLSAATVRDTLVVLRSVLKHAAASYPGTFPAVEIRYPKEPKKEARVLSLEEQRRFMACLREDMDECRLGILLALLTGLRVGEVCALRWEHICLKDKLLRVEGTMQRLQNVGSEEPGKTKVVIGQPKSESSQRTIPLPDSVAALCAQFDPGDPEAFLLTGTRAFMEPRKLQRRLKKLTDACGLEGVHFHTLRHSFATRCMEVGFEIKSLSEILGHASTSITLDRYVHASMEVKRDNMNRLAAAI